MKIHHNLKQGTAEWLATRMGRITGTDVGPFCLDPRPVGLTIPQMKEELDRLGIVYKKSGSRAELIAALPNAGLAYMELCGAAKTLLIQKITDARPQDPWQIAMAEKEQRQMKYMPQIDRGNSLEPAARAFYERKTGRTVTEVGFIESDCETYGMSPDGLIYAYPTTGLIDRILELKNPMPATHRRWLIEHHGKGTVPAEHYWQVQMGMVCGECEKGDFLSFCPGEAPLLVTLHRSKETEELAEGLRVLAEEREILEDAFASMWDLEYGIPGGELLMCFPNGRPMFDSEGMPMNDRGEYLLAATSTWRDGES